MRRCRELECCNQFQRLSLRDCSAHSAENRKQSWPRPISGANSDSMRVSRCARRSRLQSPKKNLTAKSAGPIPRITKTRNLTRRKNLKAPAASWILSAPSARNCRESCIQEDLPLDILVSSFEISRFLPMVRRFLAVWLTCEGPEIWKVRVLCYLNHEELRPVFRVCKKFREAACIARQCHFDFTTPERKRFDGFARVVLKSSGSCPPCFDGLMRPGTPNAPRHNCRNQKSRLSVEDMRQITAILFPFPDKVDALSKISTRSCLRSGVAHRVLFSENDLCEE